MKMKLALATLLGVAAWSLSSIAMAWDPGPCPTPGGSAPCIEAEVSGNTFHFNGNGSYAGVWKGLPTTGADFEFVGNNVDLTCGSLDISCTLSLGGKVQKCQDSSGAWRLGVQVNSSSVTGGFACSTVVLGGFPWYAAEDTLPHCPFNDDCDNFIPYVANPSTLEGNFGEITIDVFGSRQVTDGHVHQVIFTPGTAASFTFNSRFYDCDENDLGCGVDGVLTLQNATSLDIY